MSLPLSNKQKFYLSKDARRAWLKLGKPGTEEGFRREQVKIACGAEGLRNACNDDYLKIKSHFEQLEGATGRAFETTMRHAEEALRQNRHNLATLLCEHTLAPAYADEIAQSRFGCSVMDCTAEQVLDVLKTVKARVIRKRVEAGDTDHRGAAGARPKRRDKKKKPDPLDPTTRMPALPSRSDDEINADLELSTQTLTTDYATA